MYRTGTIRQSVALSEAEMAYCREFMKRNDIKSFNAFVKMLIKLSQGVFSYGMV